MVARSRLAPGSREWLPRVIAMAGSSTIETCEAPTTSPVRKRPSFARIDERKPSASDAWPNASWARPFRERVVDDERKRAGGVRRRVGEHSRRGAPADIARFRNVAIV